MTNIHLFGHHFPQNEMTRNDLQSSVPASPGWDDTLIFVPSSSRETSPPRFGVVVFGIQVYVPISFRWSLCLSFFGCVDFKNSTAGGPFVYFSCTTPHRILPCVSHPASECLRRETLFVYYTYIGCDKNRICTSSPVDPAGTITQESHRRPGISSTMRSYMHNPYE